MVRANSKRGRVWYLLGLGMILLSFWNAYWANYIMVNPDWAAPTAFTLIGFIYCLPVSFVFFAIGTVMEGLPEKPPKAGASRPDFEQFVLPLAEAAKSMGVNNEGDFRRVKLPWFDFLRH